MSTSAKTRLTWSLAILLVLTTIATSVNYVVSAQLAQAKDASQGLRQIALITGPNIPPQGLWAFDISFVDDQSQIDYLADASNASVDLIDTRTDTLIGQIGGFRGFHGSRETQGPGGVLVDDLGQLWASDGDSMVKVIDLSSRTIVATLHTGGTKRADEMAYDPGLHTAYCASGQGKISVVRVAADKLTAVGDVPTTAGLKSIAVDTKTHSVWTAYAKGDQSFVQPFTPGK